ncbi:alpha/beta hydrolase [Alkalihalophilus pseudofirmus]|uniref:Alpha/beta hydrolase n=1 Tax=Alkalihalophilus pseudofirmus TaxID=79885 RepID=A0AAJ2KVB5_ALKPS|nr:alpha/beta hydrolase [Alkalihalophilus pseudofirmus]MDV2884528.1 alpha/beta hydrolase [Alkalihalophilus pseudofirmus]
MPTCNVNNVELYYEVHGEGEPIIFTHGASWNHKLWDPQVEYFSNHYQVIVWDVRGHGKSTLPPGRIDTEDLSRDLIGLLDHLGIEKATLCGLSMGGHISIQTAIRYPQRVDSIILIGAPFTSQFNWVEKWLYPMNLVSNRYLSMSVFARLQARFFSTYNPDNKVFIKETVSMLPRKNWVKIWDAVTRMDSSKDLEKILCPALILYGEYDILVRHQQVHMNRMIPKSTLKVIKHAHHATSLDNPRDVNAYIDYFLESR